MTKKKPILYIVCGYVGAGKTTTANLLSRLVGAPVASVDSTLKAILPKPSFVNKDKPPTANELLICYNIFVLLTKYSLSNQASIIIDGAFAKDFQRKLLIAVAKKHKANYKILYVFCPDNVLKKRVENRFALKQGVGFKAHLKIRKAFEPFRERNIIMIDSSKNVPRQLKNALHII